MSTVDEIIASGRYVDRRGRPWEKRIRWSTSSGRRMWSHLYRLEPLLGGPVYRIIDENQMRLLIERDQHRDVCEGLRTCVDHPVPHVVSYLRHAGVIQAYPADRNHGDQRSSVHRQLPEAMGAARALAVGA